MPSKNSNHICSKTLGRMTVSLVVAYSILVIVASLVIKSKAVSYERLRHAYDGLSPRDYKE